MPIVRYRVSLIWKRERKKMNSWTVWVGGSEMDSHLLTLDKAQFVAQEWKRRGYDDVVIEKVCDE